MLCVMCKLGTDMGQFPNMNFYKGGTVVAQKVKT